MQADQGAGFNRNLCAAVGNLAVALGRDSGAIRSPPRRLTMNTRFDPTLLADTLIDADDADSPIDEWSLDDLDRSADLSSVRSAWTYADEQNE